MFEDDFHDKYVESTCMSDARKEQELRELEKNATHEYRCGCPETYLAGVHMRKDTLKSVPNGI
jgi:hypothetical protein